jgi:hypothetical protein
MRKEVVFTATTSPTIKLPDGAEKIQLPKVVCPLD